VQNDEPHRGISLVLNFAICTDLQSDVTCLMGAVKSKDSTAMGSRTRRAEHVEEVEVRGHIIDSLILPRILDCITQSGGSFELKDISIGHARHDISHARIEVQADNRKLLSEILAQIYDHGAVPIALQDCQLQAADIDGTFPEGFYSTTNQRTQIRLENHWVDVADQEMDCGILVDRSQATARCIPMTEARIGMEIVVGHTGVRVFPEQRERERQSFEFMNSNVSTEKPKGIAVRQIAQELFQSRAEKKQAALVGGPAIVHTGSVEHVSWLIRNGYFQLLLAGNALAAHDIERAMFGTSLGVDLERGNPVESGHEHHLRAINRVRRAGGISQAVEQGILRSGIMYECVQHHIPFLLAGSIRDDGPLPEVVTDAIEAQRQMRQLLRPVSFCLMIATTLHSVAVGNLLPAWVKVVCIDINPSTVIKLSDRGSFQTIGLVTDVEPFFRTLVRELETLQAGTA
jgi:lysine-ketoglutarate reductase/saccharopine dehydrogenase-like protein (TIGR00300 family)